MLMASEFCQQEHSMNTILRFLELIIDKQFRRHYAMFSQTIQITYYKLLLYYLQVNRANGNLPKNHNLQVLLIGFVNLFKGAAYQENGILLDIMR